ncbi:MAG: helix-turn-helix transcriptional regulator [Bacteroidales bacterium]|nr:helix-turn-helix transcriptional regulator [Bacteroidales bacterium]
MKNKELENSNNEKLTAFIEVSRDGLFSVCTDTNPICMIAGYGDSVSEAMDDFKECHEETIEMWAKEGKTLPQLDFEFRYDTVSFLQYYGKIISLAGLQRLTGINRHQLSHYVTGKSKPSAKTVAKIQQGVTTLGKELSNICLA